MLLTISWWNKVPISESVFWDLITPKYSVHLAGFLFSPHGCFVLPGGWLACTKMQDADCKGEISLKHHHQKHFRNKDLFSQNVEQLHWTRKVVPGFLHILNSMQLSLWFLIILNMINEVSETQLGLLFFFSPGLLLYIFIFLVCLFSPPTAFMGVLFFTISTSTDIELVLQSSYNSQEEWEHLSFLWFRQVRVQSIMNILAMRPITFTLMEFWLCHTTGLLVKQHGYHLSKWERDSWLCSRSVHFLTSSLKSQYFLSCSPIVPLCIKHFSNRSGGSLSLTGGI